MRRIDRLAGRLICAILTPVVRSRRESDRPPERILLVKLVEQGALVAARPAISRAIRLVGSANVHLLVSDENAVIVRELGLLDPANIHTIRLSPARRLAFDTLRVVGRLRRVGIDAGADLEFFSRFSAILLALTVRGRRAGLHSFSGEGPWRGDLFTHRVACNPRLHASDVFEVLVDALRGPPDDLPTLAPLDPNGARFEPLVVGGEERGRWRRRLEMESGLARWTSLIVVNTNAGDRLPLRRWPADRYVELVTGLLQRLPDSLVVLVGTGPEAEAVEEICRAVGSPRCLSIAGRTSIRDLLVVLAMCDVLVTSDSGPAHFAELTATPSVVLFGPESPAVFAPRGADVRVMWAGLPCSPCIHAFNERQSPCRHNRCMDEISVDGVLAMVLELLGTRGDRD